MTAKAAGNDEVVFSVLRGVATIRLNRPHKYNAWREEDTELIRERLKQCAENASIGAVILTGTGTYYSSGADILGSARLQRPSTMRAHITRYNQGVFDMILDFPKPLLAAVNGPAVGVGVTSSSLTDAILASTTATFHTPFADLGLPPEGCSSFNFARLMGEDNAAVLLRDAWKIDAETALRFGLVKEVLPPEMLMTRAQELAEQWIATGYIRTIIAEGLVEKLKVVNAKESIAFGNAILEAPFYQAQLKKAAAKGKRAEVAVWWTMGKVVPLLSRL
eukprot:TRINITY_DN5959_c0_g2_i1.p1 TRINITY_DN5959_c0_g2~~TRINITY_DN5959_c0_g2_i1.p1  ORF type:complete len:277 (-),score=48.58 TRINITY_DN5959_c0_g2_i1:561-1391(-)